MSAFAKTTALVLAAVALLLGGIWLGGHPESLPDRVREALVEEDRALRAELIDLIRDDFYKPVKDEQLEQGELKGVVRGLDDRFSHYMTPKETDQFEESVAGHFEGVGMSVDQDQRGLKVINVFDGSPAKRGGIKQGDYITEVNGRSIAGMSSDLATARIKGPAGTRVALEVVNPQTLEARTLKLKRAQIDVPNVDGRIEEEDGRRFGYVSLATFSEGAHGVLRREIDRLLTRGAEGIVFDLRGNGGGLLQEAVLVSSIFIEDGLVVSTKGRNRREREFNAQGDAIPASIPLVVLADLTSASASEIVAGAIKDRGRGEVVGTRTFGKGVFQEVKPLSNGGLLDLTVGQYYLPNGENIGNKGVTPNMRAKDDPRTERDEALPVALRTIAEKAAGR